jgi:hypothetical protein
LKGLKKPKITVQRRSSKRRTSLIKLSSKWMVVYPSVREV